MSSKVLTLFVAVTASLVGVRMVLATDGVIEIKMTEGRFEPLEVVVPASAAFQVHVTNADKAAIEFESFELHRERVVQPGETITVYIPALQPGSYPFFDDLHDDTPHGTIVAK